MPLKDLKKAKGRPSKRPTETELSFLYSQMTAKEVAAHYGVSLHTVKTWIAYYRRLDREEVATDGK